MCVKVDKSLRVILRFLKNDYESSLVFLGEFLVY